MAAPIVHCVFHKGSFTATYIVSDSATKKCAILDSVWDYDSASGTLSNAHIDKVVDYVKANGLTVEWILETHVHADHITGAQVLKRMLGGSVATGKNIVAVQRHFAPTFPGLKSDGSQFDKLFEDHEEFFVGSLKARVVFTPGHTAACATFIFGDAVFAGDVLFMPDFGTGRCDFPDGSSSDLYHSVQKLFDLPPTYRLFVCHDYAPNGRELQWETTIGHEKDNNILLNAKTSQESFVSRRDARDATLDTPKLLYPALQVNLNGGHLFAPESNGISYIRIPVTLKGE